MKLGIRAHDYGRHNPEELTDKINKVGFKYLQLAIPRSFSNINDFDALSKTFLNNIHDLFLEKNLEVIIFSCYQDLSNPDPIIRQSAVDTFIKCLEFNTILKAHAVGTETSYEYLSKMEKQRRFPYMMDSLYRITEAAEKFNQDFAIEPVAWHPLCDVETTREVIDALGTKHVKVIFDLANVLERPDIINQSSYWKYCFDILGDRIMAIHLKDFIIEENGTYVAKLLGNGCMDFSVLRDYLRRNPDIPVIREEIDPRTASRDIEFIRTYFD
ncbi:MAG: sugar phosphate isomerase/epimerase [Eubacterium sp.]|nr:sugar phosphate isomerase/epimerase [Eubacterium sp.]